MREYYKINRKEAVERSVAWAKDNKGKRATITARYRDRNRETLRAANRRRYLEDRAAQFAHSAARRARRLRAFPAWADKEAIKLVYDGARYMTDHTGIVHEVDHLYPLKGETVSGLHVHWNLRIITGAENRSKANKHPDVALSFD